MISPERHDLALLVGDLQADDRLAGNDLDHAHADAPTARAPDPWRELLIWLAFTPGAGRNSKRVTTGPGCTATTSASTPKSCSLISTRRDIASSASAEYDCSRGARLIEQRQRRQLARLAAHRTAAPGARARRARSSAAPAPAARCAAAARLAAFFCSLAHRLLARLACARARRRLARAARARCAASRCPPRTPAPSRSMTVNQDTPKASDSARQPGGRAAAASRRENPAPRASPAADQLADHAAGALRQRARLQCSVASAQLVTSISTNPAVRSSGVDARAAPRAAARAAVPQQAARQHQRKQERRAAEQEEQHIREPGADRRRSGCGPAPALPVTEKPGSSRADRRAAPATAPAPRCASAMTALSRSAAASRPVVKRAATARL